MRDARGTAPKPVGPGVDLWVPGREHIASWLGHGVNLRVRLAGVQGTVVAKKQNQGRWPWVGDCVEGLAASVRIGPESGVVSFVSAFFLGQALIPRDNF